MLVRADFTSLSKKGKKKKKGKSINNLHWPILATQHKSWSEDSTYFSIHYNIITEDELLVMPLWMSSVITEKQAQIPISVLSNLALKLKQ